LLTFDVLLSLGEITIELDRRKKIELKAPPRSTEYEIKQLETG